MRILVDENIPLMTVSALRELGHDVKDVRGSAEQSLSDPELWAIALDEARLFVTTDKGFAT
jgi:predicted nuclease of predicted toxin-antitoxin system